jgi:capsular polysaccharide biosynthesis protein
MTDVTDLAANRRPPLTLGDLIMVPVRRWVPVVGLALVGLLLAALYLFLVPPAYTATSVVVLRPVVENPFTYPSSGADRTVNMNVENGIATSNEVVDAVAGATGITPDAVRASLVVEVPVGALILRFLYKDPNESKAVTGANTAAETYLSVREGMYRAQRDAQLASYDQSIKTVSQQEQQARNALPRNTSSGSTPTPAVQAAIERVNALNQQLNDLAARRADTAAINVSPGNVTRIATAPLPSNRRTAVMLLAAGLFGGLIAGVVLAFVRESLDRRVRTIADAEEALGLPALGEIRRGSDGADMRYAAMAVANRLTGPGPHRLVVLSARANEGRAAFYERLAVAMEKEGHAVRRGLVPAHAAARQAPSAVHVPDIPSGSAYGHGNRVDTLLDDEATSETTLVLSLGSNLRSREERRQQAGAVTLDPPRNGAPPLGERLTPTTYDDGWTLVNAAPAEADEQGVRDARGAAALVVVARDRTRVREVQRLVERLRLNGVEPLGFVVVPKRG